MPTRTSRTPRASQATPVAAGAPPAAPAVAPKAAAKATRKTPVKAARKPAAPPAGPKPPQAGAAAKADKPAVAPKAAKPASAVEAAKPAKAPKAPKAGKPNKEGRTRLKPVRDSFTMPEGDFTLIGTLKARALGAKRETKKSELLRAGLHALAALDTGALVAALNRLAPVKVGRPRKGH